METSDDPSDGVDNSAGSQVHEPPHPVHDGAGPSTASHTNPVQVMPCQIQSFVKFDDQGRRYMVLENLPLNKNYVANWINNGGEFAIGGTPKFISDALSSELAARGDQDSMNQRTQSWHVVAFPDSNMSNAPISHAYHGSEATERYPTATQLRPTQQGHQNNQRGLGLQQNFQGSQTTFVQQTPYSGQPAQIPHQSFLGNQQPMPAHNSAMGGYGREYLSVPRSQQSQFTTATPSNFNGGGGSIMAFPPEQLYSQAPQQGSMQGFSPNGGPAQGSYQGQANSIMFNQSGGFPTEPLPQVHRPVFDKYGYIVGDGGDGNNGGMYDGNLYNDNIYSTGTYNTVGYPQPDPFQGPQQQVNQPQQVQDTGVRSNPQLADAAQSFYSFVENEMDVDENDEDEVDQDGVDHYEVDQEDGDQDGVDHYEVDQEDGDQEEGDQEGGDQDDNDSEEEQVQDEGIAMGNTSGKDATSPSSSNIPQEPPNQPELLNQPPEIPPAEILWASDRSPYRFQDRTGMDFCDYCNRPGHEAEDCLKWDPNHYDKPVCTACNNCEHSLDECPKFRAMPLLEKQNLLLHRGAGRPGVRSQYHAWPRYVRGNVGKLPLTRRFLHDISTHPGRGTRPQDVWEEWDYNQGVPGRFRDSVAEALAGDHAVLVDERFMDGKHGFGSKVHPGLKW